MKHSMMTAAAMSAIVLAVSIGEACTATSTVDRARQLQDREFTKAARDAAREFIDSEGWVNDALTVDAGTGALLNETSGYPIDYTTAGHWRKILEDESCAGHGLGADREVVSEWGVDEDWTREVKTKVNRTPTVREHMRLHVWEWDQELRGTPVTGVPLGWGSGSLLDWANSQATQNRWAGYAAKAAGAPPTSTTSTGSAGSASTLPPPSPKAAPATPAPAPETIVHHAG